jgi:putative phage-type endonuclease
MDQRVEALLRQEQYQQRTPAWYAVRDTMLTASDVAAALDIKPFESYKGSARKELLKRKLNPVRIDNAFTAHGNLYEDIARKIYEDKTGETVLEFGLLVHPVHKWLGASPDGVTMSGKVVEIKCPMTRPIVPGHVPEHYYPQVQIVMEVCGLDETAFIQYKPEAVTWPKEAEYDVTIVKRDREWFRDALPKLLDFFNELSELKKEMRDNGNTGDQPVVETPNPKSGKPESTTKRNKTVSCLIKDDLYGESYYEMQRELKTMRNNDDVVAGGVDQYAFLEDN